MFSHLFFPLAISYKVILFCIVSCSRIPLVICCIFLVHGKKGDADQTLGKLLEKIFLIFIYHGSIFCKYNYLYVRYVSVIIYFKRVAYITNKLSLKITMFLCIRCVYKLFFFYFLLLSHFFKVKFQFVRSIHNNTSLIIQDDF